MRAGTNARGVRYEIVMPFALGPKMDGAIKELIADMQGNADVRDCWGEASLRVPVTDAY